MEGANCTCWPDLCSSLPDLGPEAAGNQGLSHSVTEFLTTVDQYEI